MRPLNSRLLAVMAKLVLIASTGVVFQSAACSPSNTLANATQTVVPELTRVFVNTIITTFVSDQLGVQNALSFG